MISCYINPNKAGLFDGRIFWGRGGEGGRVDPSFILQEEFM